MHPHINIRFYHNHSDSWKYYKAKYDGIGYLLNKYIEEKISLGLLDDKKFEIKILLPYKNEYIELSQGEGGYYISIETPLNFLEYIQYIDYFSSNNWESLCKQSGTNFQKYNEFAKNTIQKNLDKYTVVKDSSQFSEIVKVWSEKNISINYSLENGLFYKLDNEILDKTVSRVFPFIIKDLTFILRPDFKEIFVYKNNKLINSTILTQSVLASDYNFYYNKNSVILSFFKTIIMKYDIERNIFY